MTGKTDTTRLTVVAVPGRNWGMLVMMGLLASLTTALVYDLMGELDASSLPLCFAMFLVPFIYDLVVRATKVAYDRELGTLRFEDASTRKTFEVRDIARYAFSTEMDAEDQRTFLTLFRGGSEVLLKFDVTNLDRSELEALLSGELRLPRQQDT